MSIEAKNEVVASIIECLDYGGQPFISMVPDVDVRLIVITCLDPDRYLVDYHPNGETHNLTRAEMINLLTANEVFIDYWSVLGLSA